MASEQRKTKSGNKEKETPSLTAKQLERILQERDEKKAKENGETIGGVLVFIIIVAALIGAGFGIHHLVRHWNEDEAKKAYKSCWLVYGDSDRCEGMKHKLTDDYWSGLSEWEKNKRLSALQEAACEEHPNVCSRKQGDS